MVDSLWPAILLAVVAGFVDALGYVGLAHLFTAHMSGNAAAIGAQAGQAQWSDALLRAMPLPAFIVGGALGTVVVTFARRARLAAELTPSFLLEIALLTAFLLLCPVRLTAMQPESATFVGLVSLLAAAMGVQAATLHRVGNHRVNTTFVSGMLMATVEALVGSVADPVSREERAQRVRCGCVYGAVFLAFMLGAGAGSFAEVRWGPLALVAPIGALGLVAVEQVWNARDGHRRAE